VVFVLLGLAASVVGRTLSGHRVLVLQLPGLAIFLAGLKLMGFLRVPWMDREARPWLAALKRSPGLLWPFLFGAAFALGWSPCIGPILRSVLAFASTADSSARAALYLSIYAMGLILPLVLVSLVAPLALRLLDRAKHYLHMFELASGSLLVAMGLLFITGNESFLMGTASAPAPSPIVTGIRIGRLPHLPTDAPGGPSGRAGVFAPWHPGSTTGCLNARGSASRREPWCPRCSHVLVP